jgi:glucokinase
LPGWDDVPIVRILHEATGLPVALENDANAGALAEWQYGAGKGYRNVIFLTFGTGLGAGLILDGRLYTGTNDLGGEAGHIRLADEGPIGYNKRGSFEGFCSGTGLAQLMAFELLCLKEQVGEKEMLSRYKEPGQVTGRDVVEWSRNGDELALRVVNNSGKYLGRGLSILIDLLNPELIVIGSMGVRLGDLLFEPARKL